MIFFQNLLCALNICYICAIIGGLAHLARALAWQARGSRFESDILHQQKTIITFFSSYGFFV